MPYRLLAGMAALCVTVLLGSARGDIVVYYDSPADSLNHRLKPNTDSVRDVALSPDGKTLVVAGRGGFFLHDADTGKRLADLAGKTDYGTGAVFGADGKSLYTADAAGNLLRWDVAKRTVAFRFPQVHSTIARITLSHDGSTLASTDGSHTAIWDAQTGKLLHAWSPPPNLNGAWSYRYGDRMWAPGDSEEIAPRIIRHHLALSPDGRWWLAGRTAEQFKLRAVGADADIVKHAWPQDTAASIDVAPDGKSYAVSTRGNRIEIVAAESLRPILGMKSPCADCFVRYSPDGRTLVGYQPDFGVLSAIDPATGNVRWRHQQAPAWRTTAVAIVGRTLATGDSDRRVRLYDLVTGRPFRTIDLPAEPARKEAVEQPVVLDYSTVVTYLHDQTQTPTTSPHIRHRLGSAHLWYPAALSMGAFLNDGHELLVTPYGQMPIVYDTQTGQPARRLLALHEFLSGSHGLEYAQMSRDRRRIFMTSGSRLYVWDMLKQRLEHDYQFPAQLVAVAVAPDGKRFAVAGQAELHCPQPIYVGSVDDPEIRSFQGHEFTIARLAFSADGKRLFSASALYKYQINSGPIAAEIPGLIVEWDIAEARMVRSHKHAMSFIACSADGGVWALQEANRVICQVFDWQQQKVVGQIEERADTFAFTPDGTALATGGNEQVVQLWDARTGKFIRSFAGHPEQGTAILCFSEDGALLATYELNNGNSPAGSVRLWNVRTGAEVCVNPAHRGPIQRVAYAPDGHVIVSAGDDRRILWWDAKTGKLIHESHADPVPKGSASTPREPQGHRGPIQHLCFCADGSTLATADIENIYTWNTTTRKLIGRIPAPVPNMKGMMLTPDGKHVVTVHPNGTVDTWEIATRKKSASFNLWDLDPDGELAAVVNAEFSHDARLLAIYPPRATEMLVFDVARGKMVSCLPIAPPRDPDRMSTQLTCHALAFSADGRYLAASVQETNFMSRRWNYGPTPVHSVIHVWEVASGAKTNVLRDIRGIATTVAFTPDGRSLLHSSSRSSSAFGGYGEWDFYHDSSNRAQPGAVMRDLGAGTDLKLFVGSGPATVCLTTGLELPVMHGLFTSGGTFAFSPDGQSAVTCDHDRTLLLWDAKAFLPARQPSIALTAGERDAAWADLLLLDGAKVHAAIGRLARDPDGTVPLLKSRLTLPPVPEPQRLQELIRALGSDHFTIRASAQRQLAQFGELADPVLREVLTNERDPQRRRSIEALIARNADQQRPECLREDRAVEILEKLDSAGARALLAELANGPPGARLARMAAAAVARGHRRD